MRHLRILQSQIKKFSLSPHTLQWSACVCLLKARKRNDNNKKKRKPERVLERKTTACPISRKEARTKKMFAKHSDPGPTVLVCFSTSWKSVEGRFTYQRTTRGIRRQPRRTPRQPITGRQRLKRFWTNISLSVLKVSFRRIIALTG